jgi:TonB family protein
MRMGRETTIGVGGSVSHELQALLKERARIRALGWPVGLGMSICFHSAIVAGVYFTPHSAPKAPQEKIRWVTLPAAGGGVSGGSAPTEEGLAKGKQRRVEEVAPAVPQAAPKPPVPTREAPQLVEAPPAAVKPPAAQPKGTNPNPESRGTASVAAKGAAPVKHAVPGAAGSGSGGGVGQGSGIPGLRPTKGIMGGTGILQEFIGASDFPLWYAQQVQDGVTRNWIQLRGGEGRVQIYFRILRTGKVEAARVEISSGRADLDDLALQAVRRTNLPRLPEEFGGDSLGVRFWFNYTG